MDERTSPGYFVVSYIGVCKDGDAQKILSDAKSTLSIVLRH